MSVDRSNREDYYFEAEDLLSAQCIPDNFACLFGNYRNFEEGAPERTFATPLRLTRPQSREA